jgi:hypothetical protein
MATELSPHFTLEELVHSDFALRHQIDNSTSNPGIIEALRSLAANILEPIRVQICIVLKIIRKAPDGGARRCESQYAKE